MTTPRLTLGRMFKELEQTDWADTKDFSGTTRLARKLEDYFTPDRALRTITYSDLLEYVRVLKAEGNGGGTINRKLAVLSKAFRVARRHDQTITKPEFPYQKAGKPRSRVLTEEETTRLLAWEGWSPKQRALATFLADTGCRLGEALKLSQIRFEGDECTFLDTKNGSDRTIVLTPAAKAAVPLLRTLRAADRYTFQYAFNRAREALGLEGVCVHTLRHSALTRLAEATQDALMIQKWAGHRSLNTTQRYVKATRKGMEKLAEVMARRQ